MTEFRKRANSRMLHSATSPSFNSTEPGVPVMITSPGDNVTILEK